MKTEFKVFKSDWGYSKIEELIREYQKEHHLEIKNVVAIRNDDCNILVGAVFEVSSEYEELKDLKYRSWLGSTEEAK